jgi:hypothetical protein
MKGDPIPMGDHVARHCRYSDLIHQGGQPIGVTETAFQPRVGEVDGLSAVWAEFFRGGTQHNVSGVRSVTKLHARDSHRIALMDVSGLHRTAAPLAALTILHDPDDNLPPDANAAHVLIGPTSALHDKQLRQRLAATIKPVDLFPYR